MAKTGMSMIEASKYVKAKGLYKPITGGARTRSGVHYEEPQPVRRTRPACDSMARRGRLVSKLMRENPGMTLGNASKYIKEKNLAF